MSRRDRLKDNQAVINGLTPLTTMSRRDRLKSQQQLTDETRSLAPELFDPIKQMQGIGDRLSSAATPSAQAAPTVQPQANRAAEPLLWDRIASAATTPASTPAQQVPGTLFNRDLSPATGVSAPASQSAEQWRDEQRWNRERLLPESGIGRVLGKLWEPVPAMIDYAQSVIPGVSSFQRGAGDVLGVQLDTPAPATGPAALNTAARFAGNVAGAFTNPAAIEQNLVTGPLRLAEGLTYGKKATGLINSAQNAINKGVNKVNPLLNQSGINLGSNLTGNLAQRAVADGLAGAYQNTVLTGVRGQTDADELALGALEGAGYGVGGGIAFKFLGEGFKSIGNALKGMANRRAAITPETEQAVINAINQPASTDLAVAGKLRSAPVDSYINRVMTDIKPEVNQRMTPPLENPNELAKWIKANLGDEVSLNEVRRLSYDDMIQLSDEIKKNMSMYDVARQVAKSRGYDLDKILNNQVPSLKNAAERLRMGRVSGAVDAPSGNVRRSVPKATGNTIDESVQSVRAAKDTPRRQINTTEQTPVQSGDITPTNTRSSSSARERGVVSNLKNSDKLSNDTKNAITRSDEANYDPINNTETLESANARLESKGLSENKGYLLNKNVDKEYFSPEDIALGYRMIDEYNAIGDYENASQVALKLAQAGTKSGQNIQIHSIYNRLTPEGILKVASRIYNEGVKEASAQKALSNETTNAILDSAKAMQKASGNQQVAKDAISIIEKARLGEKLTESEISILRKFQSEAKRLLPAENKAAGTPKTRGVDAIKKASSRQAAAARQRLNNSRNIGFAAQGNGNPIVDLAIIGFDHMMTGAVKFADFAGKMKTEFGSKFDDVLDDVYLKSWGKYRRANKMPASDFEKMVNRAIGTSDFSKADASALRKMAIELSQLEGTAKKEAMAELQMAFNTLREGTAGKKAAAVLRSFQLGNVRTILRNEISNNAFYLLDDVRRKFIATPIDVVASKITGKDREIFFKSGPQSWKQYFTDWGSAYKQGKKGLNPGGLQSQYDLGNLAFNPASTKITDQLGSFLERNVGAFLKAGDYAASNRAISNELSQLSKARAYAEGYRGKDLAHKAEEYFHTADESLTDQARKYGEYMTFQDKNFLSDAAVALRDRVLNANKDFGLGNIVINYPKTPANIFMRAIDYSPLGFLKFMGQMGKVAFKKEVTKKDMINTFTRALAGTGIAGIGMYLSQLGILNILPSKDIGMSELERKAGQIPNSLNIGALMRYVKSFGDESAAKPQKGDLYASIDWFQPLAIPLSVGAAYGQAGTSTRFKKGVNAADAAVQSLDAAMESFGNMSAYRNIKDLVGSDYSSASEKTGKLVANTASAFVPSLLGQLRNVVDPKQRDVKVSGKNDLSSFFGQAIGQTMNRLPGLSQHLPEKVDTFGDTKQNEYGVGARILNSFVNPSIIAEYNPSPEAKAVLDLIERTGETRLAPNRPQKSFTYNKQTYGFTPEQYREYQVIVGNNVTEALQSSLDYLNNPNNSDENKIKRIDNVLSKASDKSKKEMMSRMGIR